MEQIKKHREKVEPVSAAQACETVVADAGRLIDSARRVAVRTLNSIIVADYWLIGRSVVELVQNGLKLGLSDEEILRTLGAKLASRSGEAFSAENLHRMCRFYLAYSAVEISSEANQDAKSGLATLARRFPLSWSHYLLLIEAGVSPEARAHYENEARRHGWSAAQLRRQMQAGGHLHDAEAEDDGACAASATVAGESFEDLLREACLLEFFGVVPHEYPAEEAAESVRPRKKPVLRRKAALKS